MQTDYLQFIFQAINADIQRQASMAANVAQVTGTLTNSLQTFRMP